MERAAMEVKRFLIRGGAALMTALCLMAASLLLPEVAFACLPNQQTCSATYGINEAFFGSGGQLCDPSNPSLSAHSTNYCAKTSAGELGVGNTSSTSFQAQAGFNTDRVPSLTFIVTASTINFGAATAGTTMTGTSTFSVETYLASGYQVVTASAGPSNGLHSITTLTTPTANNTAAEQFGINLVANNGCAGGLPASLGANPVQVPSTSFSFGAVASGYNVACQFKYVAGDVVASSPKSSGETDYTVSYIINITNSTPEGAYSMSHVLVATSTY